MSSLLWQAKAGKAFHEAEVMPKLVAHQPQPSSVAMENPQHITNIFNASLDIKDDLINVTAVYSKQLSKERDRSAAECRPNLVALTLQVIILEADHYNSASCIAQSCFEHRVRLLDPALTIRNVAACFRVVSLSSFISLSLQSRNFIHATVKPDITVTRPPRRHPEANTYTRKELGGTEGKQKHASACNLQRPPLRTPRLPPRSPR